MNAREKFEARLRELGLPYRWQQQGTFGKLGAENESGIFILVHESFDQYTEFVYPPMKELEKNEDFRQMALDKFWSNGDLEFVGKLYRWYKDPSYDCPLHPMDVYFCYKSNSYSNFEDDEEIAGEMGAWNFNSDAIEEYCPHCDTYVDLEHDFKVQKCPNCEKWNVPCSICPLENCSKPCPLERLAFMLNEGN